MDNIIPLAGANPGDRIGAHVVTKARMVRNKQAYAMFQASLALYKLAGEQEEGGFKDELGRISRYLRDSSLS